MGIILHAVHMECGSFVGFLILTLRIFGLFRLMKSEKFHLDIIAKPELDR